MKKNMRNEATDQAWRYQERGFPQKNEPKRTQYFSHRRVPLAACPPVQVRLAQPPPAGGDVAQIGQAVPAGGHRPANAAYVLCEKEGLVGRTPDYPGSRASG
jgi:hypothetical protein